MDEITRARIRQIFLSPRPSFALLQASDLLGMTLQELKREVEDGAIVAASHGFGVRVAREEMIAAAMRRYEQAVVEEALGSLAETLLPEAIRLVELRARVPRYQRDMLRRPGGAGGDDRRRGAGAGARGCGLRACRGAGPGGGRVGAGPELAGIDAVTSPVSR